MVKKIVLALMLMLVTAAATAARLSATLDKRTSLFGEPIQLRLVGNIDLATLDLSPLKKDFEVFSSSMTGGTHQGKVQSVLEATLYPLRVGKLSLPALTLGSARSQPLSIEIQPANISLRAWVSPAAPMVREPTTLHLEIRDEGDLTWSAPTQLDAPNIHLGAVSETTRETQNAVATLRLREYRWSLLALKHGGQSVIFPILDAYKFGQRLRFPVTPVTFRALPAPAYLPIYLPIGQPVVRVEPLAKEILLGRPASRVLEIEAPGLSAEGVIKALQFNAPRGMRLYAPSVAPIKIDGREGLRVSLSFVAEQADVAAFPEIKLPYFNPKAQSMESFTIPAAPLTVRDPLREKFYLGALLLFSILSMVWIGIKVRPWLQRVLTKRAWLAHLNGSADAAALYRALTHDTPWRAKTLRQSAHILNATAQAVRTLEQLRFGIGESETSFIELKNVWREAGARTPIRSFSPS